MTEDALGSLGRLQHWMQEVISHPQGAAEGVLAEAAQQHLRAFALGPQDVVSPSRELSSVDRLQVYAGMYFSRLIEVLAQDFPAARQFLGEAEFDSWARHYLDECPSRHFSLNVLGAGFPAFLERKQRELKDASVVHDVARVEWAIQEVFDEQAAAPVEAEQWLAIPQSEWAGLRLELIPALRLLQLGCAVNPYIDAVRAGDSGQRPRADTEQPHAVVVYRKEFTVWRGDISQAQRALLLALMQGCSLGEAVQEPLASGMLEPEELAGSLQSWFQEWTAQGLFCAVHRPPS